MYYVYLIKSQEVPEKFYVGYTTDLVQRLATRNSGGSFHTAKYMPWELVMHLAFEDETKAKSLEKYLKSQYATFAFISTHGLFAQANHPLK